MLDLKIDTDQARLIRTRLIRTRFIRSFTLFKVSVIFLLFDV